MPIRDPDQRNAYMRAYMRRRRRESAGLPPERRHRDGTTIARCADAVAGAHHDVAEALRRLGLGGPSDEHGYGPA
jgi:hypothetical protein